LAALPHLFHEGADPIGSHKGWRPAFAQMPDKIGITHGFSAKISGFHPGGCQEGFNFHQEFVAVSGRHEG
jgi:hypothetical protein